MRGEETTPLLVMVHSLVLEYGTVLKWRLDWIDEDGKKRMKDDSVLCLDFFFRKFKFLPARKVTAGIVYIL